MSYLNHKVELGFAAVAFMVLGMVIGAMVTVGVVREMTRLGITRSDAYGTYVTHEVSGPSLVEAFNALAIAHREATHE